MRSRGTRWPDITTIPLRTGNAGWPRWPNITAITLRASGSGHAGNSLDSLRASLTGWPRLATLAGVALRSGNTRNTLRASNAISARWTRWTRWTNAAGDTGDSLRTYIAAVALCASHTRDTGNAGNALRPCVTAITLCARFASHASGACWPRGPSVTLWQHQVQHLQRRCPGDRCRCRAAARHRADRKRVCRAGSADAPGRASSPDRPDATGNRHRCRRARDGSTNHAARHGGRDRL